MEIFTEKKKKKSRYVRLYFSCTKREKNCLYPAQAFFTVKSKIPKLWLHLMFLNLQVSKINLCPHVYKINLCSHVSEINLFSHVSKINVIRINAFTKNNIKNWAEKASFT